MAARTLTDTPFSPYNPFSTYFDTESNNIVFEFEGKVFGTLNEDYLSGNVPVNQSYNDKIIYTQNSVSYIIDVENYIAYKTDTGADSTIERTAYSSVLTSDFGNFINRGGDNRNI